MSILLMAQVWECDLDHSQQSVLLALADHARDDGTYCFPSVARVAWKTGYSVRQTQRILKQLRYDLGILILVEDGGKVGSTNQYTIDLSKAKKKKPFEPHQKLKPNQRRALLAQLIQENGPNCAYCGEEGNGDQAHDGNPWELDRIIPGKHGGKYVIENVRLSCGTCNKSKNVNMAPLPRHPDGTPTHAAAVAPKPSTKPSDNHTPEGNAAAPEAAPAFTANHYVSLLAEDLEEATVPLLPGRKARYGKEFKALVERELPDEVLHKVVDRIVERWHDENSHYKLTAEQALGDVNNGKGKGRIRVQPRIRPEDRYDDMDEETQAILEQIERDREKEAQDA